MTRQTILANARLILPDRVVTGRLHLEGDRIAAIEPGEGVPAGAEDCGGDWVAPGLVELHTDNLERHIEPRPKVDWPHAAALVAHDAELAGCGITTVFDAMRVGSNPGGKRRYLPYARRLASELLELRGAEALRISHFLHLRAEICSETLPEEMDAFGPADRVGIVSLMDHTPGQRQFRDLSKLRAYVSGGPHLLENALHSVYGSGLVFVELPAQRFSAAKKRAKAPAFLERPEITDFRGYIIRANVCPAGGHPGEQGSVGGFIGGGKQLLLQQPVFELRVGN